MYFIKLNNKQSVARKVCNHFNTELPKASTSGVPEIFLVKMFNFILANILPMDCS